MGTSDSLILAVFDVFSIEPFGSIWLNWAVLDSILKWCNFEVELGFCHENCWSVIARALYRPVWVRKSSFGKAGGSSQVIEPIAAQLSRPRLNRRLIPSRVPKSSKNVAESIRVNLSWPWNHLVPHTNLFVALTSTQKNWAHGSKIEPMAQSENAVLSAPIGPDESQKSW